MYIERHHVGTRYKIKYIYDSNGEIIGSEKRPYEKYFNFVKHINGDLYKITKKDAEMLIKLACGKPS